MPYKNPEDQRRYEHEHRKRNPEYYIAVARKKHEERKRLRAAIIAYYGSKCSQCDWNDPRALQIDHIFGDGRVERKIGMRNLNTYYKRVLANPERYQLLCANHNWVKRIENNEAPGGKYLGSDEEIRKVLESPGNRRPRQMREED